MSKRLFAGLGGAALFVMAVVAGEVNFDAPMEGWYPFTASSALDDFSLGLSDWNKQRAGAQGRIAAKGDKLFLAGKEIKLWGLNNEYFDCMPEKAAADFRAAFYARQGFNSIRQHKYNDGHGWAGIGTKGSGVEFEAGALDRFDYYNSKLIEHGLYLNLSSNFIIKYGEEDAARVECDSDFRDVSQGWKAGARQYTPHGSIYFSPGLQALHIEQLVKLLEHKNPYTNKSYAEEPAVAFVEIYNEDSVLFYGTHGCLHSAPIIRKAAATRFATWLKNKYKSEAAWQQAWSEGAIVSDLEKIANGHLKGLVVAGNTKGEILPENFANGITPWGQPWFYDATADKKSDSHMAALRPRMLDTIEFMISIQDEFYDKCIAAIRKAGYPGEIIASNWQAGSMTGHYANLFSDRKVGTVDRHNYFGGAKGGALTIKDGLGKIAQASQFDKPGSGLLSTGMQQVLDRPFMFSEWTVVQPTEWYIEAPVIIGAYGMGLQGWDVSYLFSSYQKAGFAPTLDAVKIFSMDTPVIMGVMPAISRMVRRGDVAEAKEILAIPVPQSSLRTGEFSFWGTTEQAFDFKSFAGDKYPCEALATLRLGVDFESTKPAPPFSLPEDAKTTSTLRSATGELAWSLNPPPYSNSIVINTRGTIGFAGFASQGTVAKTAAATIAPEPGFSVILLTATAPDKNLDNDSTALLTALARARNTGMAFSPDGKTLITKGTGPILLEPVRAQITFGTRKVKEVRILDHNGNPTGKTIPIEANSFSLDTARDQTPYYQVVF